MKRRGPDARVWLVAVMIASHVAPASAADVSAGVPGGLQVWFAINYLSGAPDGPKLMRADLSSGEVEEIGFFGIPGATAGALTFHPSGTLFAIDYVEDRLLTVDPVTGAAHVVGPLGLGIGSYSAAFTADACGRLWLLAYTQGGATVLHELDPESGLTTPGVPTAETVLGVAANGEALVGIAAADLSRLVRIDPATGEVDDVLSLEAGNYLPLDLEYSPDGDLWGAGFLNVPIDPLPSAEFRIDPAGRVFPVRAPFYTSSFAISAPPGACGGSPAPAIPAASSAGLAVLATLLAVGGATLVRRRGTAPQR